ncbi:MAG: FAD binding domain-containing protein [Chloroflexi bacterium]|nr:FAD binding domain-containing protein [Chloroflexota bacterium]
MITAYHRPQTLDEALTLLTRPNVLPLGGGTLLSKPTAESIEVADLQALGLDTVKKNGNTLELGAALTLQSLLESEHCPPALKSALKLEAPLNIRNSATLAGTLIACDGRSTFASVLLALDAKLTVTSKQNGEETLNIGDLLPLREQVRGKLITKIVIPLTVKLAFDYVSRTPADKPIVCAALAQWNSGRTRLALGGYGKSPILAMDGTEAEGIESAVKNAFHEANDEWASAEYRMDAAATLVKRCLAS